MEQININPESGTYRIGLILPDSGKVLAVETKSGYGLPRVSIPPRTRPARALHHALLVAFDIDAFILDLCSSDAPFGPFAIAEIHSMPSSSSLIPVRLHAILENELSQQERQRLQKVLQGDASHPFSRPGWIREAISWLEEVTGIEVSPANSYEQYNAGHGFTLIRFRMLDGSVYWLKATNGPNAHELGITLALSRLCETHVPQVIDSNQAWNAWITREDAVHLDAWPTGKEAHRLLLKSVDALAAIQSATLGSEDDLFAVGVFDQRPARCAAHAEAFFAYLDEAMGGQKSTRGPRISSLRLRELCHIFEDCCMRLDDLSLPITILHGDMNLGNLLFGTEYSQLTDWAESYVGFPLCTFQHLLLLNPLPDGEARHSLNLELQKRYASSLLAGCVASVVDKALALAPLIAAFSALYGRGDWLMTSRRHDLPRQSYARTLARYMDRAARDSTFLAVLKSRASLPELQRLTSARMPQGTSEEQ